MKTFLVLYKYFATVVVEAEDEAHALDVADDCISTPWGVEMDEAHVERELKTSKEIADEIKSSSMHSHDSQRTPYTE